MKEVSKRDFLLYTSRHFGDLPLVITEYGKPKYKLVATNVATMGDVATKEEENVATPRIGRPLTFNPVPK